ncbi:MAG: serine/threonine-protein kinase [Acidobacteria bacterium]|nr:serine/threonine-protein kinase [Acidobacteriota bacterium]
MNFPPKAQLGGYELGELLGSGAMGEVYRARDLKLSRDVAVKLLRPELASDPERLQRFEREARAASALNHPNLVHIYDIGREGSTPYIVMELVEGRTLRQLLSEGPLPMGEVLRQAVQLAEGLAKAHAGGIIHRDLKPENVIVTDDGFVKILDFGLAKLVFPDSDSAPGATQTGAILGTAGYMSPEQARGEPIDMRSDQFSLGAILYELATGHRAFEKETFAETLVAIIRSEPTPLKELAPKAPPTLVAIVERLLAKEREDRFASTREAAADLRSLLSSSQEPLTPPPARRPPELAPRSDGRSARWGLVAGVLLAGAAAAGLTLLRRQPPAEQDGVPLAPSELRVLAAAQAPEERALDPDLAPDGTMLAYVLEQGGQSDLFLSRVAGGGQIRLTDDDNIERSPRFAPDGEHIAFARRRPGDAPPEFFFIPTSTSEIYTLSPLDTLPIWSPDGRRLAFILREPGSADALASADLDGGALEIHLPGDGEYPFLYYPDWSPDGDSLAVQRSSGGLAGEIWQVFLDGRPPRPVASTPRNVFEHHPRFTADGRGVVVSSNRRGAVNLWLLPVAGGSPRPLTSGPGPDGDPSVARDGSVAFLSSTSRYTIELYDLEGGGKTSFTHHSSHLWAPAFSPDGGRIAFSRAEADGTWSLWLAPVSGGEPRRLTETPEGEVYPRFTPDGETLVYTTWSTPHRLFQLSVAGGTAAELTSADEGGGAWADISPDGNWLVFARSAEGVEKLFLHSLETGEERQLTQGPGSVPRWSPDGRRIAFSPDRSWDQGVYTVAADGSDLRRLSDIGGWPVWWPDGDRIGFIIGADGGSQVVRWVAADGGPVHDLEGVRSEGTSHVFDVSPDGSLLAISNSLPLLDEIWLLKPAFPDHHL